MKQPSYNIYHDLIIRASETVIFNAISDPKQLEHWWPLKCTGSPKQDALYNFYFSSEYDWYGKVQHVIPNKAFHIKMTKADTDWNPTSFGFDLESQTNGTLVKFWHSNWLEINHHFRRSSFCWAILLNGLKNYVEHGQIIPFEQRN